MSAPSKKTDSITLRIDPETKAHLEALAEDDQRPLSAFILKTLREHFGLGKPSSKSTAGKTK